MTDLRIALLVVSDRSSAGVRKDGCEPAIRSFLESNNARLTHTEITPDGVEPVQNALVKLAGSGDYDLILTAGGTGVSPRDQTPEATQNVIERETPGVSEAMRAASLKITPNAILSRGVAGFRGDVFIINLPGSPKAAVENIGVVWQGVYHGVLKAKGDKSDCAT